MGLKKICWETLGNEIPDRLLTRNVVGRNSFDYECESTKNIDVAKNILIF